jgi:ketosteroid isomerase-like protein
MVCRACHGLASGLVAMRNLHISRRSLRHHYTTFVRHRVQQVAEADRWKLIGTTKYSGTFVGKNEAAQKLVAPLFAQLEAGIHAQIQRAIAEDDYVVVQFQGRARTKSGVPYDNTYCMVMRVEDGKIKEIPEYFDTELTTAVFGR